MVAPAPSPAQGDTMVKPSPAPTRIRMTLTVEAAKAPATIGPQLTAGLEDSKGATPTLLSVTAMGVFLSA